MKYLVLFPLFLFDSLISSGQTKIKTISVGFENGIKKDYTTFERNDGGYFLSPQYNTLGRRFLLGDYYYGFTSNITLSNKWFFELGYFSHVVAYYNIFEVPQLNTGSSSSFSSPYKKWTFGIGREVNLGKRFFYLPSIQFSYIPTTELLNEINGETYGSGRLWMHNSEAVTLTNINLFIGIKNTIQWQFNQYLKLNLGFAYNHGLQKSHIINQRLSFLNAPSEIYKGVTESRLSHGQLFLSVQYNIWNNEK